MLQIRLGVEAGADASIYAKPEFDCLLMEQIREGLEKGLDASDLLPLSTKIETWREQENKEDLER